MADSTKILDIVIQGKDDASGAFNSVGDSASSAGGKADESSGHFQHLWEQFAIGSLAASAIRGGIDHLKDGISNMMEVADENSNNVAQMNAVIKSTGDASGVSATAQNAYAESLAATTPTTKAAIMAGENMISTFTNIKGSAFTGATQAANNMATFFNGGLAPSMQQVSDQAMQIGKALNDPATGMAKLQREGVSFNAQEQEQIKSMSAAGNAAGAQAVMLQELQTEFGGAAVAAGTTFTGGLAMAKNGLMELESNAGAAFEQALLPALKQVIPLISSLAPVIDQLAGVFGGLGSDVAAVLPSVITIISNLADILSSILPAIGPVIVIVGEFAATLSTDLVPVFAALNPLIPVFASLLQAVSDVLTGALQAVLPIFISLLGDVVQVFKILEPPIEVILQALGGAFTSILHALMPVMPIISEALKTIATAFATVLTDLTPLIPMLATLITQIISSLVPYLPQLINSFMLLLPALLQLLPPLVQIVTALMPLLIDLIKTVLPIVSQLAVWISQLLAGAIKILSGALSDVLGWIATAVGWFSSLGSTILNAVKGFGTLLYDAGKSLIDGLVKGVTDFAHTATDAVKNVGSDVVKGFKSLLGIHSPSTVFADIGGNIGAGLVQGVKASAGDVADALSGLTDVPLAMPGVSMNGSGVSTAQTGSVGGGGGNGGVTIQSGGSLINIQYEGRGQFTVQDATSMAKEIVIAMRGQGLSLDNLNNMASLR